MNEIIFRIENRHLLKLGWQECIAQALSGMNYKPEDIPQNAKLCHRPIPNKAQTVFHIFVTPEGQDDPVVQSGKIRGFYEFMAEGAPPQPLVEVTERDIAAFQREAMIQKCIAEQNAPKDSGIIIH